MFFDEADVLFGELSGVENSHDRCANFETDCPSQRMQAYRGPSVLPTKCIKPEKALNAADNGGWT
jgi:hypothetical protein